jgi:hypothetical protein
MSNEKLVPAPTPLMGTWRRKCGLSGVLSPPQAVKAKAQSAGTIKVFFKIRSCCGWAGQGARAKTARTSCGSILELASRRFALSAARVAGLSCA